MSKLMNDGVTAVERRGDRELVVTRTFDAPVPLVFDAWTKAELFKLWWAPKSNPVPLLSCNMDVRTGGGYSLSFGHDVANSMTFFGKYLEVTPPSRLVWTNDEGEEGSVTTVTFEEAPGGQTRLVLQEAYPTQAAFDESLGMEDSFSEQFGQLDELLVTLRE